MMKNFQNQDTAMMILTIHTDGACKGNPGVGGWGAILQCKGAVKEIYGFEPHTTNNRMELTAVIQSLLQLKTKCKISLHTDSTYVQKGMTTWIDGWIAKKWKGVKNVDLWQQLYELSLQHIISWHWVKAHNGHELNERADYLANLAIIEKRNVI